LGVNFTIHNPFLFHTKGQMCQVLKSMDVVDIALQTQSCDRVNKYQTVQCGRCSSCLLRREALLAAKINDETLYRTELESGLALDKLRLASSLPQMSFQVCQLQERLTSPNAWSLLAHQHPTLLADFVNQVSDFDYPKQNQLIENLLSLYKAYVAEWAFDNVAQAFAREIEAIRQTPRKDL
jgi:hypothetical protein